MGPRWSQGWSASTGNFDIVFEPRSLTRQISELRIRTLSDNQLHYGSKIHFHIVCVICIDQACSVRSPVHVQCAVVMESTEDKASEEKGSKSHDRGGGGRDLGLCFEKTWGRTSASLQLLSRSGCWERHNFLKLLSKLRSS
jgi:hypothetical protein